MGVARLASRVGPFFKDRRLAIRALGARRGKARLVLGQRLNAVDESVAEIVGQFEARTISDVAVFVGEFGVAFGIDAFGLAIVGDLVGLQDAALIIDLGVADRRDRVFVLVEDKLFGLHEHLVGLLFRRWGGRLRVDRRDKSLGQKSEKDQ